MNPYIIENDGTVTTLRDIGSSGFTVNFDATVGSGALLDAIDAPADYDSSVFTFDPYI